MAWKLLGDDILNTMIDGSDSENYRTLLSLSVSVCARASHASTSSFQAAVAEPPDITD